MAPVTRPQCGAPPPAPPPDKETEDKPRQDPELPHDYRCNLEFHKRWEIDQSRRQFNWKVVEPYDGTFNEVQNAERMFDINIA